MYKALPTITESADKLQQHFRAAKDAQKRQRLQALYLLRTEQATSRVEVAKLLAVHRHTVRAWLAAYATGGLTALLTIHKAPGRRSAVVPAVRSKLQMRLQQPHGFGSYREIQQYLADAHHIELAYSTVHGLVRYQLQAKPKSPRRSHPKKTRPPLRSFSRRSPRNF
jgi:transposase